MDINKDFDATLLDNVGEFNSDFFKRFSLSLAEQKVELSPQVRKSYLFPAFFKEVVCSMGIFLCDYKKAIKVLDNPSFTPVSMLRNRALIVFTSYQYKTVNGLPGYNEIGMTIPVFFNRKNAPPILPLLKKGMKNFGYQVVSMPVTSYENQCRGLQIWGLPKILQQIDIDSEDGMHQTVAYDKHGEVYFSMKIPMDGKLKHMDEAGNIFSVLDQNILTSQTYYKGAFLINKFNDKLWKERQRGYSKYFSLSDSAASYMLSYLDIDPYPLQTRYCSNMESVVSWPQRSN